MDQLTQTTVENQGPLQQTSLIKIGIRGRLMIGFTAIIMMLIIAVSVSLIMTRSVGNFSDALIKVELPTYAALIDLNRDILQTQTSLRGFLLTGDNKFKDEFKQSWNNIVNLQSAIENLSKNWSIEDKKASNDWNEMQGLLPQLKLLETKAIDATDKTIAIQIMLTEIIPQVERIADIMNGKVDARGARNGGLLDMKDAKLQQDAVSISQKMQLSEVTESILLVLGILISIFIALLTARTILNPINIFRQHSNRIATGDLTRYLAIGRSDELGQLGNDLNSMTKNLSTITKQITEACHSMVSTLEEVQRAADVQTSGASEQASSINQITASLGEIEKSSAQTMEKAKALGEAASHTQEKGQLGLQAVEQSVTGILLPATFIKPAR